MESQTIIFSIPLEQLKRLISDVVQNEFKAIAVALKPNAPQPSLPEYLTRKQTAHRLGISLVTLNEWTKSGRIQGYRIGSRVRYKSAEMDAALKAIRTTQSSKPSNQK